MRMRRAHSPLDSTPEMVKRRLTSIGLRMQVPTILRGSNLALQSWVALSLPKVRSLIGFSDYFTIAVSCANSTSYLHIFIEGAPAPDEVGYDFERNSCVHYAGNIWRAIQAEDGTAAVKETSELAEFIINNVVDDDGFIELVKKKENVGGFRASAMLAVGGKAGVKSYVADLVYGQLNIVDPDNDEASQVSPIDQGEVNLIEHIMAACPGQVEAVQKCYDNDGVNVMDCANCVWSNLIPAGKGLNCDGIDAKIDTSVANCAGSCNTDCADVEANLHSCAVTAACNNEALVVQIA